MIEHVQKLIERASGANTPAEAKDCAIAAKFAAEAMAVLGHIGFQFAIDGPEAENDTAAEPVADKPDQPGEPEAPAEGETAADPDPDAAPAA